MFCAIYDYFIQCENSSVPSIKMSLNYENCLIYVSINLALLILIYSFIHFFQCKFWLSILGVWFWVDVYLLISKKKRKFLLDLKLNTFFSHWIINCTQNLTKCSVKLVVEYFFSVIFRKKLKWKIVYTTLLFLVTY